MTTTDQQTGGASTASAGQEFVVSRVLNAPRALVFKAWTESERLAQWWGPKGMQLSINKMDLQPGGIFHYRMQTPDGQTMWGRFTFREIQAPERLVFVVSFADEQANPQRHPFSAEWPLETLTTVTFTEEDGKTTMTMRGIPINATETECKTFQAGHGSMQQGWGGTLEQLEAYLAKA
jgi:uncharacterized protein YndB with AHSA1/START domain